PAPDQRNEVHRIIYEELCQGQIRTESRDTYLKVVSSLAGDGAQAVILGCTEIGLLVRQTDTEVPLYDTTEIHASQAVARALNHP
ncbi:MAG: aspartate/glutamate racemase family protein, partial [Pseudomonadota bacterium]|nr:aspartate/glutamate racemase family protein [Pseudomonadota bacterium]